MALRKKIIWLLVQLKVITNSTAQKPVNQLRFILGKTLAIRLVSTPVLL